MCHSHAFRASRGWKVGWYKGVSQRQSQRPHRNERKGQQGDSYHVLHIYKKNILRGKEVWLALSPDTHLRYSTCLW